MFLPFPKNYIIEMHIVLTFTHIVTLKLLELPENVSDKSQRDCCKFFHRFYLSINEEVVGKSRKGKLSTGQIE